MLKLPACLGEIRTLSIFLLHKNWIVFIAFSFSGSLGSHRICIFSLISVEHSSTTAWISFFIFVNIFISPGDVSEGSIFPSVWPEELYWSSSITSSRNFRRKLQRVLQVHHLLRGEILSPSPIAPNISF